MWLFFTLVLCMKAQSKMLLSVLRSTQDFPREVNSESEKTKLKSNQNLLVLWLFYIKYSEFLIGYLWYSQLFSKFK